MVLQEYYGEFVARDWQETTEGGPVRVAVVGLGAFGPGRAIPAFRAAELCGPTVSEVNAIYESAESGCRVDLDERLHT